MSHEEKTRHLDRSEEDEALSGNMQSLSDSDPLSSQELKSVLRHWTVPSAPSRLDSRVMATYRHQIRHRSWWRLSMSFWPTPLPVRLAVGASVCLLAFVIFHSSSNRNPMTGPLPQSSMIEGADVEISGYEQHYITYINGSGFEPVRPVRIQINRGSDQNEN
jgi:hypothetical protein